VVLQGMSFVYQFLKIKNHQQMNRFTESEMNVRDCSSVVDFMKYLILIDMRMNLDRKSHVNIIKVIRHGTLHNQFFVH